MLTEAEKAEIIEMQKSAACAEIEVARRHAYPQFDVTISDEINPVTEEEIYTVATTLEKFDSWLRKYIKSVSIVHAILRFSLFFYKIIRFCILILWKFTKFLFWSIPCLIWKLFWLIVFWPAIVAWQWLKGRRISEKNQGKLIKQQQEMIELLREHNKKVKN